MYLRSATIIAMGRSKAESDSGSGFRLM